MSSHIFCYSTFILSFTIVLGLCVYYSLCHSFCSNFFITINLAGKQNELINTQGLAKTSKKKAFSTKSKITSNFFCNSTLLLALYFISISIKNFV